MRKDDEIRNWQETETERIVKYETENSPAGTGGAVGGGHHGAGGDKKGA